jgi:hypothetical protein
MPSGTVWNRRYLTVAMYLVWAVNAGCALINPTVQDQPVDLSEACVADTPARRELSRWQVLGQVSRQTTA